MNRLLERLPGMIDGRHPRSRPALGTEGALLFASGSGLSDRGTVVSAMTDLPVAALASHVHRDQVTTTDGRGE